MKPNLRIVREERPDLGMRADVALDHKFRAKRTGQSPVEYAASVEVYRRPGKNLWVPVFALLLIGAAVFILLGV